MVKGKIKRLLPGGNTSLGFYSYFSYVIDVKEARKIYLLKGGPGTGKSSMMKKLGNQMIENGYDVEFHHCSADPESIDAIVIPRIKVAVLDATSPHMIDPKYPGAIEKIINLGEYWEEKKLEKNKENIILSIGENSNIYKRTYRLLAAAKIIHDDIEWIYSQAMDFHKVNQWTNGIIDRFFGNIKNIDKIPKERHLFGSGYTHLGHIDFIETYMEVVENIYYIKGEPGTGKSTLLNKIILKVIEKGYNVEIYHEPLEPNKIENILVPELNLGFSTNSKYKDKEKLDLGNFLDMNKVHKYTKELDYSEKLFKELIDNVADSLQKSKKNHDIIENYYVGNLDFKQIDEVREKILTEILNF